jgi:ribosomal protein L37AE/L43A
MATAQFSPYFTETPRELIPAPRVELRTNWSVCSGCGDVFSSRDASATRCRKCAAIFAGYSTDPTTTAAKAASFASRWTNAQIGV